MLVGVLWGIIVFMKSYKFIITGKVQGVYYRAGIRNNTLKENFRGYVKNLFDGRVEAVITSEESECRDFIKILQQGSKLSKVFNITQRESEEHFSDPFEVR